MRKTLYRVFAELSVAFLAVTGWFWIYQPAASFSTKPNEVLAGVLTPLTEVLNYFLPTFFEGLITFVLVREPFWLVIAVVLLPAMIFLRGKLRTLAWDSGEKARQALLPHLPPTNPPAQTKAGGQS